MDRLFEAFFGLFTRPPSTDDSFEESDENNADSLKAQDVVDLMQHQQQQEEQQKQKKASFDKKRRSKYDMDKLMQQSTYPLTADLHGETGTMADFAPINYETEFVDFINRNAPHGFSHKLESMLPYIGASFITWPTYWIWRGYHWQTRRRTERIGVYIQRTFQHAKVMQIAILSIGLLMAASARSPSESLEVHEVAYKLKNES